MNLLDLAQLDENQCREYIEQVIWPNGPVCPHCKGTEATKLKGKSTRPGVYKCKRKECRKPFTVTVGTVMERSRIPMKHWLMLIHLLCSSKQGFSAKQIERELGVTYKTAWFLLHRIRHAMDVGDFSPKLHGAIELNETYIGGKPRMNGTSKRGRGTKKTSIVALVERGGAASGRGPLTAPITPHFREKFARTLPKIPSSAPMTFHHIVAFGSISAVDTKLSAILKESTLVVSLIQAYQFTRIPSRASSRSSCTVITTFTIQ